MHFFVSYFTKILVKISVSLLLQNAISWILSDTRTWTDGRVKSNSHFFNPNVPKPGRR